MNTNINRKRRLHPVEATVMFTAAIIFALFLSSCDNKKQEAHSHEAGETYTCPMHPQVVQDGPGTCPVCGMDLVKKERVQDNTGELMLSDSQIKLANITTQTVSKSPIGQTITLNARVVANENTNEEISSRVEGRIEKLYIKETGVPIIKGAPLYVLYSETLLTLQQEYLLAKEQYESVGNNEARYASFLDAAERKLMLYGMSKKQIEGLTRSKANARITFNAPSGGIVTEVNVTEGQYVGEGTSLYELEDISSLWIEAELYPRETSLVKRGDIIGVRVSGADNALAQAKVTFLSPEYRANSQVVILRAELPNNDGRYKPGQQAQVYLTHSTRQALSVPVDAVIRKGNGSHVYVQRGKNTFKPAMVKTGIETFNQVEITQGLQEGDTVAISGAYLLYSELVLKRGTDPMAGHQH